MSEPVATTDRIHRFSFRNAPVRGQWVRLDAVLSTVRGHQPYPDNVARLLGEMLAAVAMVADGIKFKGAVTLQSRGPGPLTTVLAECRDRHLLRGIARWPEDAVLPAEGSIQALLGRGQLALSLIPEDRENPYQGLVGLAEDALSANLIRYFADSEQLPTWLTFAGDGDTVTGLLLQRMPDADTATEIELDHNDAFWAEARTLAATVTCDELAQLPVEALLRRLFAEQVADRALTLQPPRALTFACSCNREKTSDTLRAFGVEALHELLEETLAEGREAITVTCEICGKIYAFDAVDAHLLHAPEPPEIH